MDLAKQERYIKLVEEASEVIHCVCKIKRFGEDGYYDNNFNNAKLFKELADLLAILDLMIEKQDLDIESIELYKHRSKSRLNEFLTHQND